MDPIAVQKAVEIFADFLLKYFLALAAVGSLAMALIELWKKLRDSRTRYHARMVSTWMKEADEVAVSGRLKAARRKRAPAVSGASAYAELIHLTTGLDLKQAANVSSAFRSADGIAAGPLWLESKPENALFALELDRMMGHIQEAAEIALSNPSRYPSLYLFMTAGADPKDVSDWAGMADHPPQGPNVSREESKRRADLFARLQQIARRKLDAFQLYSGYRWTNWNMFNANIVGMLVLFGVLLWINATHEATGAEKMDIGTMILLSLFGGMLSPIAKDIVVALRKVRQGV